MSKYEATVSLNKYGYRSKSDNVKFNPKTGKITEIRKFEDNNVRQNLKGLIYSLHVGTWGGRSCNQSPLLPGSTDRCHSPTYGILSLA